jgi:SAM-dependent methyltransferase
MPDQWASGDAYEPYIGRWSRPVAAEFLDWIAMGEGMRWLDVGCGTGALTAAILARCGPASVVGADPSLAYLGHAHRRCAGPRAAFAVADARAIPLATGSVDAVVSALALNFVPEPATAAAEMGRVARPGGTVAAYLWDYAGGMQLIRRFWDAAVALDPDAARLDEATRFPLCHPDRLGELLEEAGLERVETRAIEVPTVFRDFEDFWRPFLGAQGPAPGYVTGLSEERRAALRDRLRAELPTGADGSIALSARAWAARARVA